MKTHAEFSSQCRAFSLIEILVVLGVMALMISLLVPAFISIGSANQLTSASQVLIAELNRARQDALARNRAVEVRFLTVPPKLEPTSTNRAATRALQRIVLDPGGEIGPEAELGRLTYLPGTIRISPLPALSTQSLATSGSTNLPAVGSAPYTAFRFRPNGSANISQEVFWTVVDDRDTSANPANFATVQLDPRTGRVRLFRP